MNVYLLIFTSVDPCLGKVDKSSLSQETLMELFTEGIQNRERVYAGSQNTPNIKNWYGIACNSSNEITEISWNYYKLRGTLSLQWLPDTIKTFQVEANPLRGTADLTLLPVDLKWFSLAFNQFEGKVNLTLLPEGLLGIFLKSNNFCGTTDFSHLPKSLRYLNVSSTKLAGEVVGFDGTLHVEDSYVTYRQA